MQTWRTTNQKPESGIFNRIPHSVCLAEASCRASSHPWWRDELQSISETAERKHWIEQEASCKEEVTWRREDFHPEILGRLLSVYSSCERRQRKTGLPFFYRQVDNKRMNDEVMKEKEMTRRSDSGLSPQIPLAGLYFSCQNDQQQLSLQIPRQDVTSHAGRIFCSLSMLFRNLSYRLYCKKMMKDSLE